MKIALWKLYSTIPGIAPAFVAESNANTEHNAIMYHWIKTGIRYDSAEKVIL